MGKSVYISEVKMTDVLSALEGLENDLRIINIKNTLFKHGSIERFIKLEERLAGRNVNFVNEKKTARYIKTKVLLPK